MGDFNAESNEPAISDFCEIYNTKNIVKEKPCFKNPANPICIDQMHRQTDQGVSKIHLLSKRGYLISIKCV